MKFTVEMRQAIYRRRPQIAPKVRPLLLEASALLRSRPRVAKETMGPEFTRWVETQKFKHPQTQNDVQFKSLPVEEQAKIRARWQQTKQQPESRERGRLEEREKKPRGEESDYWKEKRQREDTAFATWLGDQDPELIKTWQRGRPSAESHVRKKFEKDQKRRVTDTGQQQKAETEKRFKTWLSEQDDETRDAWKGGARAEKVKVRQQFGGKERKERAESSAKLRKKREEEREATRVPLDKFREMSKDDRPRGWIDSDNGNRIHAPTADIGPDVKLEKVNVGGTIDGKSDVKKSRVDQNSRVSGSTLSGVAVEDQSIVEDSTLSGTLVSNRARVRDSKISDAKILGGTWEEVEFDGGGGSYRNSYDPKTLKVLSQAPHRGAHPGDGGLRAMVRYLSDGGRTKGWLGLGADLNREKMTKKIREHVYDRYDRDKPWMGRGASFLDELSDEDFDHLLGVAQSEADEIKARRRKKKAMLYQLTKAALEQPEFRTRLMPLVRLGSGARVASGNVNLREQVIRTAFESTDPAFKQVLVRCVITADQIPAEKAPSERQLAMRPTEHRELVQAAYETKNPAERQGILRRIKEADGRHDELIEASSIERDAWDHKFALSNEEHKTLVRVAFKTKDVGRRREILGLLKEAKYSPGFMKYVEKQDWKHTQTGNMVKFVSLPTVEQKKIHEQWKIGKKDWAKQFKPDGLGDETQLTPARFDDVKEGDRLWISWAPHVEHRVTGLNKTKGGKPVLEMVMVNPETGEEGEERYLHRSSAGNPKHDIHILPEGAKPKDPKKEKAKAEAPKEPEKAKEPETTDKPRDDKAPGKVPLPSPEDLPDPAALMKDDNLSGLFEFLAGDGVKLTDKDSDHKRGTKLRATSTESGNYQDVMVISDKVVSGSKGDHLLVTGPYGPVLLPLEGGKTKLKPLEEPKKPKTLEEIAKEVYTDLAAEPESFKRSDKESPHAKGSKIKVFDSTGYGDADYTVVDDKVYEIDDDEYILVQQPGYGHELVNLDESHGQIQPLDEEPKKEKAPKPEKPEKKEPEEVEKAEKTEAPKPTGKYKDRKELLGKGKPESAKIKVTEEVQKGFVPEHLSEDAKKATAEGLKGLTYGTLQQLEQNVQAALNDPEGKYMAGLAESGYKPGDLSKMHSTIKSLLKQTQSRKYNKTVLDVANKYDLEGEDADELYDFRTDKPGLGKKLSPQDLMQKFLAKAAPETKERMQGMAIDDFMAMYNAIMADEDEEEDLS